MKKYKKYKVLGLMLLTGCATTETVPEPVSIDPIYPPLFDVTAIKEHLNDAQREALKLKKFVANSGGMCMLQSTIDIYLVSAQNLYDEIVYAPPAQVRYEPWQIQR